MSDQKENLQKLAEMNKKILDEIDEIDEIDIKSLPKFIASLLKLIVNKKCFQKKYFEGKKLFSKTLYTEVNSYLDLLNIKNKKKQDGYICELDNENNLDYCELIVENNNCPEFYIFIKNKNNVFLY